MRALLVALSLLATSCATASAPPQPVNAPAPGGALAPDPELDGDVVALAFSGGGARAAAFSLGALQGLREMRAVNGATLLSRVRLVTSVSGGSITAAYFGQHGEAGLDTFRAAYLDKDWARELHMSPVSPLNWARLSNGSLNGPPVFADWLDREVFNHGVMRDVWNAHGVQVWLNSTDLYNGTTFTFAPAYFQALCSDLGSVRVADAVASSMAFPFAFRPVLLAPYPAHCEPLPAWASQASNHAASALVQRTARAFAAYRDPARQPYLHLVDGGVLDNLGLTSLSLMRETASTAYGPLSARDAVRVRRLTFLVINAEQTRRSNWQTTARGPNGSETASALFGIAVEGPNRSAYDSFRLLMADWERDLRTYRCGLNRDEVLRERGSLDGWDCNDIHIAVDMLSFTDFDATTEAALSAAPTRVTLPRETIDALISAGRSGIERNGAALALTN